MMDSTQLKRRATPYPIAVHHYLGSRELGLRSAPVDRRRLEQKLCANYPGPPAPVEVPFGARTVFILAVNHDKRRIAAAHGDHTVRVYCSLTGRLLHTREGHPRSPWCLQFHPVNADLLASGCLGGDVHVWDLASGLDSEWSRNRSEVIASLSFHPRDPFLAVACGHDVVFWNWQEGRRVIAWRFSKEFAKVRWVRFSLSGDCLYTGSGNRQVEETTPSGDATISNIGDDSVNTDLQPMYTFICEEWARIQHIRHDQMIPGSNNTTPSLSLSSRSQAEAEEEDEDVLPVAVINDDIETAQPPSSSQDHTGTDQGLCAPCRRRHMQSRTTPDFGLRSRGGFGNRDRGTVRTVEQNTTAGLQDTRLIPPDPRQTTPYTSRLASATRHLTSARELVVSDTGQTTTDNSRLASATRHLTSAIRELMSDTGQTTPYTSRLASATRHLTSARRELVSDTGQITTDNSRLASATRHLTSGIRELESTRRSSESTVSQREDTTRPYNRQSGAGPTMDSSMLLSRLQENSASAPGPVCSRMRLLNIMPTPYQRSGLFASTSEFPALPGHTEDRNHPRPASVVRSQTQPVTPVIPTAAAIATAAAIPTAAALATASALPRCLSCSAPLPPRQNNVINLTDRLLNSSSNYIRALPRSSDPVWMALESRVGRHRDYGVPILDQTVNTTSSVRRLINQTLAGLFFGRGDPAVANNLLDLTYKIRRWELEAGISAPILEQAQRNVIVHACKLHNDSSVSLSPDGTLIAVFVPAGQFPDETLLSVYSTVPGPSRGQCLFTKKFGPNAISVDFSPLSDMLVVGLASRRIHHVIPHQLQVIGQIYELTQPGAGEHSMRELTTLHHPTDASPRSYISVNGMAWTRHGGIVYATSSAQIFRLEPSLAQPGHSCLLRTVGTQTLPPPASMAGSSSQSAGHVHSRNTTSGQSSQSRQVQSDEVSIQTVQTD